MSAHSISTKSINSSSCEHFSLLISFLSCGCLIWLLIVSFRFINLVTIQCQCRLHFSDKSIVHIFRPKNNILKAMWWFLQLQLSISVQNGFSFKLLAYFFAQPVKQPAFYSPTRSELWKKTKYINFQIKFIHSAAFFLFKHLTISDSITSQHDITDSTFV